MHASQNMLLVVWDTDQDDFSLTDLANNWDSIDTHDHSFGNGVQINTGGIAANAIVTGLIAPNAVQNAQIANNAVSTSKIQANAITNGLLAAGSVYGAAVPNGAITSPMLDPTILPLGTVMLWWRASGSSSTPGGGWEIMDGRAWSSITNSLGLNAGNIPDMRGTFLRGADITGGIAPGIGATGGSNTANVAHAHNVVAHSHTVPTHVHPLSSDGSHLHYWQGGLQMWARTNTFTPNGVTFQSQNGSWYTNTFYSMYIKNLINNPNWFVRDQFGDTAQLVDGEAEMDAAGAHSHGGATGASGNLTTSAATTTTDSQLGTISTVPQYTSLLFIMKVR